MAEGAWERVNSVPDFYLLLLMLAINILIILVMLFAAKQDDTIKRYKDTLEWYADESHYQDHEIYGHPAVLWDRGTRARKALGRHHSDTDRREGR